MKCHEENMSTIPVLFVMGISTSACDPLPGQSQFEFCFLITLYLLLLTLALRIS